MSGDLLDAVLENQDLADLDPAERRLALRGLLADRVPPGELPEAIESLADRIDGFGPLTRLMEDDSVTDVLVNGPDEVWCERDGRLEETPVSFPSSEELLALVELLLAGTGMRADASRPVCDARMADGSRLHVVLPPVAANGPIVSIRKWPAQRFSLDDLRDFGMLDDGQASRLVDAVTSRRTVLVAGATGTGKTTLAGALLGLVPSSERIVIVEETPELRPACRHAVSLVARPPNVEGSGSVSLEDLVRAALRMRPDRIVVGEARGAEALTALGAMSTGHPGSLLTVHAAAGAAALERLMALALQSPSAPGEGSVQAQAAAAIDVVVHLGRREGRRVVTDIWAPP